jgi:hypothetical protein
MADRSNPFEKRALLVAGAVAVALAYAGFSGGLVRPLLTAPVFETPYLASVLVNLSDLVVMAVLLCLARRTAPGRLVGLSGVTASPVRPLIWAAMLFVPSVLIGVFSAPVSTDFGADDLFWQGVGFPVIEEVVYRGLAVAALVRWAGWRWFAACLLPALFFGVIHMSQGGDMMEAAGIAAITGLGGLLFGWLFVRWDFNLWPPILLHVGLNSQWIIFALGETALGGWLGNGLRLAVVLGAIALTLKMAPRRDQIAPDLP